MRIRVIAPSAVLALGAAGLLAACGGSSGGGTPTPAPPTPSSSGGGGSIVNVYMIASPGTSGIYSPDPVQVKVGQSVQWANQDVGAHTASSDSTPGFDSSFMQQGQTYKTGPFNTAGTIKYHCNVHAEMKGSIVVSP
jgi:plastocyanin